MVSVAYTQLTGFMVTAIGMHRSTLTRQRLIGVFLAGVLLLYSPAMTLFDRASEWAGVPLSYLYLFGVWLLLVLLAAMTVETGNR